MEITAVDFQKLTAANPDWALSLTEKTHVRGLVRLVGTKIRYLSPLLEFHGRDGGPTPFENKFTREQCAVFHQCKELKTAAGIFHGFADFSGSGVEIIDPAITVLQTNPERMKANFSGCMNLKRCPEAILKDENYFAIHPDVRKRLLREIDARNLLKTENPQEI